MVNTDQLNELYNCLDLYVVASRVEGGPQAIIECALSKTPIISTDMELPQNFCIVAQYLIWKILKKLFLILSMHFKISSVHYSRWI